MFGLTATTEFQPKKITDAVDKAAYRNFTHAGGSIRKDVRESIEVSDEPSRPGEPPHTKRKRGKNLPDAILFDATKEDVVVGPTFSRIGLIGEAYEFGKDIHGENVEQRAFMLPGLERASSRVAETWYGSVGE